MMARILPLKISTEVKRVKEKISLEEAVAELKECGLDEMLAFYLKRYPIEPDEENTAWAEIENPTMILACLSGSLNTALPEPSGSSRVR